MAHWEHDIQISAGMGAAVALRKNPQPEPVFRVRMLAEGFGMAGVLIIAIAIAWWFAFFTNVPEAFSQADSGKTVGCLVYTSGVCNLYTLFGTIVDAPTYNPILLWVGVSGKIAKWILQLLLKTGL
jgi:hypothetical protein